MCTKSGHVPFQIGGTKPAYFTVWIERCAEKLVAEITKDWFTLLHQKRHPSTFYPIIIAVHLV